MIELIVGSENCPNVKLTERVMKLLLQSLEKDYITVFDTGRHGITTPYLIVDGVPLDLKHSIKYLEGEMENVVESRKN